MKGWLTIPRINPIDTNEYFAILKNHGVQFYDTTKRITPLLIKSLSDVERSEQEIKTDTLSSVGYFN